MIAEDGAAVASSHLGAAGTGEKVGLAPIYFPCSFWRLLCNVIKSKTVNQWCGFRHDARVNDSNIDENSLAAAVTQKLYL